MSEMGSLSRPVFLLTLLCVVVYGTALSNGFAYDDTGLILANPVVQSGDVGAVLHTPFWPQASSGSGLFRPLTTLSFLVDWQLFGDRPFPYHLSNVTIHTINTLLLFALCLGLMGVGPAMVAAALFAAHPVHVEAVANIAGRSELLAALFVLSSLVLVLRGLRDEVWRIAGLLVIPILFLLGLGSKEIAVGLIPLLGLLAWSGVRPKSELEEGRAEDSARDRLRSVLPLGIVLVGVLAVYLLFRFDAIGAITGDAPAPELRGLTTGQRLLTAASLWPQYARLMVFPLDLAADYGPAVFLPATTLDLGAFLGLLILVGLSLVVVREWRSKSPIVLGILWFAVAVLPVSQVLFPAGTILAERTLYLPSAGFCIAMGELWRRTRGMGAGVRWSQAPMVVATVVVFSFGVRTALRNPAWESTFAVFRTLHAEHPESYLAQRARAAGLAEVGQFTEAAEAYRLSVELSPSNYSTLAEAGEFFGRRRSYEEAEALLSRAIAQTPSQPLAYRLLSAQLIRRGRLHEGREVAARGLAVAPDDKDLWRYLSEGYARAGEYEAAIRARERAWDLSPKDNSDRERLVELREAAARVEAGVSSDIPNLP